MALFIMLAAVWAYYRERLPEMIPVHFGIDGVPDRWTSRSSGEYLLIFMAPPALTLLMYVLSLLSRAGRKNPRSINVPNKEKFLKLTPEERTPFFTALDALFYSTAAAVNLLFLLIAVGMMQVATGADDRLPLWSIWPGLAVVMAFAVGNTVRLMRISYRITKDVK